MRPPLAGSLPRARAVLEQGMKEGFQVGAQAYVSLRGEVVADDAIGLARPGVELTPDHILSWLSCSKIATSVAFLRLWERGGVGLDDPVCAHLPEFAAHGKERIRIRHLLTHTCGLLRLEQRLFAVRYAQSFAANVATICDAAPDPGWTPGARAGYQTTAAMLLLAEILERRDGRPFPRLVREEVFLPLGLSSCWIGMTPAALDAARDRLGVIYATWGPEPVPRSFAPDRPEQILHVMPGGNGRGPVRELGRLVECLARGGELDGTRLLSPQTVEAMTARQRTGLLDESWGEVLDWGLGLTLDSKLHHGGRNHVYGYGAYASPRTFGHSGFRIATAFCDPEHALVVAIVWNGMVADDQVHSRRQHRFCEAVYQDLGLAPGP